MDDKKKQVVPFNFEQLQDSLERSFDSPEQLLLEGYKGLVFLISSLESDIDLQSVKDSIFPIDLLLSDVYKACTDKKNEEFNLDHPEINRTKK